MELKTAGIYLRYFERFVLSYKGEHSYEKERIDTAHKNEELEKYRPQSSLKLLKIYTHDYFMFYIIVSILFNKS